MSGWSNDPSETAISSSPSYFMKSGVPHSGQNPREHPGDDRLKGAAPLSCRKSESLMHTQVAKAAPVAFLHVVQ